LKDAEELLDTEEEHLKKSEEAVES